MSHRCRSAGASDRGMASPVGLSAEQPRMYAARYRHLTAREKTKLKPTQAQTVIAAAILRQLYAMVTSGRAWDAHLAADGTAAQPLEVAAA